MMLPHLPRRSQKKQSGKKTPKKKKIIRPLNFSVAREIYICNITKKKRTPGMEVT